MEELSSIPLPLWILLGLILITQGSWMFYDAKKRGEHPWIWGFFGLLNTPTNLIIYLVVTRIIKKVRTCPSCGNKTDVQGSYCSHCGEKLR